MGGVLGGELSQLRASESRPAWVAHAFTVKTYSTPIKCQPIALALLPALCLNSIPECRNNRNYSSLIKRSLIIPGELAS